MFKNFIHIRILKTLLRHFLAKTVEQLLLSQSPSCIEPYSSLVSYTKYSKTYTLIGIHMGTHLNICMNAYKSIGPFSRNRYRSYGARVLETHPVLGISVFLLARIHKERRFTQTMSPVWNSNSLKMVPRAQLPLI